MTINQYHLHKGDDSKLHFQIKVAEDHVNKNLDHVYTPHRHTYYQMIWFKEEGRHYVDYEIYQHPANSLFLLNRGQVHYFCKEASNKGMLFHFDEIFLLKGDASYNNRIQYDFFSGMSDPYLVLNEEIITILEEISPILHKEITDKKFGYRDIIFNLLQVLITNVERQKIEKSSSKKISNEDLDIAMEFKKQVFNRIDTFLSINEFSNIMGISSKKLTSVCKEYLNETPAKVIAQLKILEAKRMLSNSKISIKEIAFSLGFDQATYFTKYFKKYTSLTPKEFIAKWQSQ